MRKIIVLMMLLNVVLLPAGAAEDKPELELVPVRDGVLMIVGQGGNIGVSAGDDGVLIIDDKFAPLSDKIMELLESLDSGPVKFVLNTHWHQDHTGGNENFGKTSTVIAHENVRKRLEKGQFIEFFNKEVAPYPKAALPVITFEQSIDIHFNGQEISVDHYAHGHTDGDSIVFFEPLNVVHTGDHFFNGFFPYVDLESQGSVQGMLENVIKVYEKVDEETLIIPGHGPLAKKADLKRFIEMLENSLALVTDLIAQEKTFEEIKNVTLPAELEPWSYGFLNAEKWLTIVYNSLTHE